jgi:dCMP deaminase
MLLIGIAGSICSGKKTLAQLFHSTGNFEIINLLQSSPADQASEDRGPNPLLEESLLKFPSTNLVFFPITNFQDLIYLQTDSRFILVSLDTPVRLRYQRFVKLNGKAGDALRNFLEKDDFLLYSTQLSQILLSADRILQNSGTIGDLSNQITSLSVPVAVPHRPSFHLYFVRIAEIVSSRSGCLRHKGGCVLTHSNKIVSTGYTGIPKTPIQCIDGGCEICIENKGEECFCNHAELNAIIEAKPQKLNGCSIYLNIFPCFQCALAIVQVKAKEVIYSSNERIDEKTKKYLENSGVCLIFLPVVG